MEPCLLLHDVAGGELVLHLHEPDGQIGRPDRTEVTIVAACSLECVLEERVRKAWRTLRGVATIVVAG